MRVSRRDSHERAPQRDEASRRLLFAADLILLVESATRNGFDCAELKATQPR